ncbi:MAG TPA: amidohydrolase family protein [bacterium]|mgnify:CR=1 FL=1|nr:amidohydrolase family protein [bacterium]HPP12140.1 amidohydrolase family protein [bacterium]
MIRFFDINAGVGVFSRPTVYSSSQQLLRLMELLHIEKALVYQSLAREVGPVEGNELLLQQIGEEKRLLPSWVLLPPRSGEYRDFHSYVEEGIRKGVRAFRVFPSVFRIALSEFVAAGTFQLLEERGLPLVVSEFNQVDGGDWPGLRHLLRRHEKLPVIFSEFRTRYHIRLVLQFLSEFANFYYDLGSCWNYAVVEELVALTGGERLLTGTNLPFSDPGQSLGMVLTARLSEKLRKKIARENAVALFEGARSGPA